MHNNQNNIIIRLLTLSTKSDSISYKLSQFFVPNLPRGEEGGFGAREK